MGVHGSHCWVLQRFVVDSPTRTVSLGLALEGCPPQIGPNAGQILLVPPDHFPFHPPSRQLQIAGGGRCSRGRGAPGSSGVPVEAAPPVTRTQ